MRKLTIASAQAFALVCLLPVFAAHAQPVINQEPTAVEGGRSTMTFTPILRVMNDDGDILLDGDQAAGSHRAYDVKWRRRGDPIKVGVWLRVEEVPSTAMTTVVGRDVPAGSRAETISGLSVLGGDLGVAWFQYNIEFAGTGPFEFESFTNEIYHGIQIPADVAGTNTSGGYTKVNTFQTQDAAVLGAVLPIGRFAQLVLGRFQTPTIAHPDVSFDAVTVDGNTMTFGDSFAADVGSGTKRGYWCTPTQTGQRHTCELPFGFLTFHMADPDNPDTLLAPAGTTVEMKLTRLPEAGGRIIYVDPMPPLSNYVNRIMKESYPIAFTLLEDPGGVQVEVSGPATVNEADNTTLEYAVSLPDADAASAGLELTYTVTASDDGDRAADFTDNTGGSVTFTADTSGGLSATVEIGIVNDNVSEVDEWIEISFNNAANAAKTASFDGDTEESPLVVVGALATSTILANDRVSVSLHAGRNTIAEGQNTGDSMP